MISIQEIMMSIDFGLIYGIIAIGIYLTFRTINFADLTCEGSFILGSSVSAALLQNGFSPTLSCFAALICGGTAGFLTGILNIHLKISDLLSGIIIAFMLYSVNIRIMGNSPNITFIDLGIHYSTFELLVIVLTISGIFIYILSTNFGLALRSIGYNKKFATISGISVSSITLFGLTLSNCMVGFGGALFSQYQGFSDISQGAGTLVTGLASVIIGEKIFRFNKVPFAIFSCIIGSILYRLFIVLALHTDFLGIETHDLNLITGIMIISIMLTKRGKGKCWN